MEFKEIIGNYEIKQQLNRTIKSNNILHSYLFLGKDGIGKKIFAKEFAKMILCQNEEKPCNNCKSCLEFENNNNPDFMQIDLEDDSKEIKVEQIRFMQEKIAEKPITSDRKVYIINDSDLMNTAAQNCLLKTLEEPPQYAVIILIASNDSKLLNTIKSRCIKIQFKKIEDNEIEKYLKEVKKIDNITKNMILTCEGSIGKAEKLINMQEEYNQIEKIINDLNNNQSLIDILNNYQILYSSKDNIFELLDYITIILYNTKDIRNINCIKYIEDTKKKLLSNSNYDMSIDNLLIRMWEEINEKYSRC